MLAVPQATSYGEFRRGLLAEEPALAIMRRLTKWAIQSWNLTPLLDDAIVVINELATNAVQAAPGHWIEMRLRRRPEGVLLECWDPAPALPSAPKPSDEEDETGRGLFIVSCMATRHGVEQHPDRQGKTVWALLSPQAEEAAA